MFFLSAWCYGYEGCGYQYDYYKTQRMLRPSIQFRFSGTSLIEFSSFSINAVKDSSLFIRSKRTHMITKYLDIYLGYSRFYGMHLFFFRIRSHCTKNCHSKNRYNFLCHTRYSLDCFVLVKHRRCDGKCFSIYLLENLLLCLYEKN